MDEENKKIIQEQMKKLPKEVASSIASVDYKTKLEEITKRQRLLIDQAGKLEMETTLVMIGLEPISDYITNLEREMGIPLIRAQEIALDVSEHIFKPIREHLHAMDEAILNGEDFPEDRPAGTATKNIPVKNAFEQNRFTDSNDTNLNREQILNEIENPNSIGKSIVPENLPTREIETLDEVPYQQDLKTPTNNVPPQKTTLLETNMAGINITSKQIVDLPSENKLQSIEKKRPFGGVDAYREPLN